MWGAALTTAAVVAASGSAWLLPHRTAAQVSAATAVVLAGLLVRGMSSTRSSLVQKTLWRSDDARDPRVALTFDGGPHPRRTPAVLDLLRRHGMSATFFVSAGNVRSHPDLARRIRDEGHELGCLGEGRSWTSPFRRRDRLQAGILRCLEAVREAAGVTPRLYRPPAGIRSPAHGVVIARNDLLVVGMARRGRGIRRDADPAAFARRFAAESRCGEILALRDGEEPADPSTPDATLAALPAALEGLAARGLRSVTVSCLLSERPYRETPSTGWPLNSRGGRLGMALFASTARLFGPRGCLAAAPLVAGWYVVTHPRAARASVELRRRLHGPAGPFRELVWTFRHFLAFGRTMIDRMTFLHGDAPPPEVDVEGPEAAREVAASARGCLLVSAHVGDWIAATRVARLGTRRMSVVAARGVGVLPHQVRRDIGTARFDVIDVRGHPVAVGAEIAAALRDGGSVAMLADRRVSSHVVRLPFLGGVAEFPAGPWAVAMITGAPVLVFFMTRLAGGRHRLRLFGPIRVPRVARGERDEAIRAAAAQYAAFLEGVVREHPLQWSNFYEFWVDR